MSTRRIEEPLKDRRATMVGLELRALEAPDLNPGSASQLVTALRAAGFKVKSTKEAELTKADDGKIVPLVLRYRESIKRAQQALSFLGHLASDGRIHGRFEPTGTDTGRP